MVPIRRAVEGRASAYQGVAAVIAGGVTGTLQPCTTAWLCARRDELSRQLDRLERDVWHTGDPVVHAGFAADDDSIDMMRATTAYELDCIDTALARISVDTYVYCERCYEEIDAARLTAFPRTTRCASCARG
jgi:RNA polymerase-binding transcription factor DksA